jgi:hypothetical protein
MIIDNYLYLNYKPTSFLIVTSVYSQHKTQPVTKVVKNSQKHLKIGSFSINFWILSKMNFNKSFKKDRIFPQHSVQK